ncbi:hypothetical protein [Gelidibacter sp.]|uniref:hypothetical protein n=1 Tax=Gelidibacter sp. TaxID=2018083 RepID=UPI0032673607
MRTIYLLLALGLSLSFTSCNNKREKTTTTETTETVIPDVIEPTTNEPKLPMDVITVYPIVKDYDIWRAGFDADSVGRQASGLSFIAVERSVEKPNDVKVVLAISDMAQAKSFMDNPRLKKVMDSLGVKSNPEKTFWSIIRYNPNNKKAGGTRLEIVHKVKDFDTWLKAFDEEGPDTRAANGLNDLAMGRSIEDPNLVHIVFEVTDLNKAKSRMADPEFKKLMEHAGVVGKPKITFYKDAD